MNKKAKNIINAVLIVFVVASAAYLVADQILSKPRPGPVQTPPPQPAQPLPAQAEPQPARPDEQLTEKPPPQENEPSAKAQASKVVVYYLYGNVRCPTCRKFETYTEKALDEAFSGELADGRLRYQPINVDKPGNRHFIDDYQLYTKTVIVAKTQDNRQMKWKNLKKIWQLVGNERKFLDYIQTEVQEYLGED